MTNEVYFIDTNALLDNPSVMEDKHVVVLDVVLREIENLERRKDSSQLQYQVRNAKRKLEELRKEGNVKFLNTNDEDNNELVHKYFEGYSDTYADNIILANVLSFIDYNEGQSVVLITNDILMKFKASQYNVEVISTNDKSSDTYSGVVDFHFDNTNDEHNDVFAEIFTGKNPFNLVENQYLHVWDDNEDKHYLYKFNNGIMHSIKYEDINHEFTGHVTPINENQKLAFDMMQDDDIKVKAILGRAGVGKDMIQISHAIKAVMEQKFDKIIWVRNNVELKDTNSIGFLPNGIEDKLKPYILPLADHLGSEVALDKFIEDGKVEIVHLGFLRGRDLKNSIIYCTEMQNSTEEHLKLLLSRVSDGSELWINGDVSQSDVKGNQHNNALHSLSKIAGDPLVGIMTLDKVERSNTAKLAELLD